MLLLISIYLVSFAVAAFMVMAYIAPYLDLFTRGANLAFADHNPMHAQPLWPETMIRPLWTRALMMCVMLVGPLLVTAGAYRVFHLGNGGRK